jgi:DNA-binding CsgD family transcriptional regulator
VGLANQPDWNDLFQRAALEPDFWLEALGQMASFTGSFRGQLIGVGGARDVPFNIVTRLDDMSLQEFVDIGGASPTVNYRVAASNRALDRGEYDSILHEQHYDEAMPLLKSKAYVELADRHDYPFGCQTNLVVDRAGLIGLAVLRKRKEGRTTAGQRRVFANASAAARRAVRLQERLEGEQARLLAGAFEAINKTAFIIDAKGRLQAMTQSAEEIITSGRITLRNRYLDARGTPFSLAQAVSALVADGEYDHIRLRIDSTGAGAPLFMEGFRLANKPWSIGHLPHAILLVSGPQRDRAGIAAFLGVIYRLTATEADIAMRLFDGARRAEIAEIRSVTAETLRGQIKAICAKTGSQNEADLIRLLSAIMA